jgi:hypothetical protein
MKKWNHESMLAQLHLFVLQFLNDFLIFKGMLMRIPVPVVFKNLAC